METQISNNGDSQLRHFNGVALLVTHYNRPVSLEGMLKAFAAMGCVFDEIVVSDDCSNQENFQQLLYLQNQYNFKLVSTPVNKGLGNNINKGQDAVTVPYTLYVQEDFCPAPAFKQHFSDGLAIMNEQADIDIARFYAYFKYPYLKPLKHGFSEMKFGLLKPGTKKFFYYSDHPHLRRINFLEKFGRYIEGRDVTFTEYKMMMSFIKHKGKGIFFDNYKALFGHGDTAGEHTTRQIKDSWRKSKKKPVKVLREAYRHVRYYKDYLF